MKPIDDSELDDAVLTPHSTYAVTSGNLFKYSNDPRPLENFNISINVTVGPDSTLHSDKHRRVGHTTNRQVIETMRQIVYQYDVSRSRKSDPDDIREYCQSVVPHGPGPQSVHSFNAQRITSRKKVNHLVTDSVTYNAQTRDGTFKGIHAIYDTLAKAGVKVTYRSMEFNLTGDYSMLQTTTNPSTVIDGKLVLDSDIHQIPVADPITGNVYSVPAAPESAAGPSPEVSFAVA